ncbi:glycine betaine ABC transporter substrate-binding protein [Flindersiella endophytica]
MVGVAAAAVAMLAAGCGLGGQAPEAGDNGPVKEGSIKKIDNLDGVNLKVGSKEFTEQLVLGQIAVAALEAAGAKVTDKTNISGTAATRKALTTGGIDMYWEYTGTGWVTHLKHDEQITDPKELAQQVRDEDLADNKIVWLDETPLNNTYAFAIREEKAKELGITKDSQLASLPKKEQSFCIESEFESRDDGFEPFLKTYGLNRADIPAKQILNMDTGVIYDQTDKGACNFGEVFTSDGRIKGLGLKVLDDDKKFFPIYNASMNIRESVYKKYPELADVFNPISKKLTTEALQKLNAEVDVDGKDPKDVARTWLKSEGFIG